MNTWPRLSDVSEKFAHEHLSRPLRLFRHVATRQVGSGRPSGPREVYWTTTTALCVAALEGGLEDLLFAAHGYRMGAEGVAIAAGVNALDQNPRKWLVADRLMAPSPVKVERILFSDFGLLIDNLPTAANFTMLKKHVARGGAGRGSRVAGPSTWPELRDLWEALVHIRNATAHGDVEKYAKPPTKSSGLVWVELESGRWSVQMPHALTAMRATLAVFNCVAINLASVLKYPDALNLMKPDSLDYG